MVPVFVKSFDSIFIRTTKVNNTNEIVEEITKMKVGEKRKFVMRDGWPQVGGVAKYCWFVSEQAHSRGARARVGFHNDRLLVERVENS